jgi:hypothetical protein
VVGRSRLGPHPGRMAARSTRLPAAGDAAGSRTARREAALAYHARVGVYVGGGIDPIPPYCSICSSAEIDL